MIKIIRSSIFDFMKFFSVVCFWGGAFLGGFPGISGGGAGAQTLPDFGTCDSRMWLSQGTQTSLNAIDTSTNPFTFVNLGSVSFTYNATAYNPLDNYGYAVNNNSPTLYRIGSNAQAQNIGTITGLPSGFKANTGDISDDGSYYIYSRTHDNSLYKVDISSASAIRIPLTRSVFLTDLAWSNGLLYAKEGDSRQLISINPVTGAVKNIGDTGLAASSLFGACSAHQIPSMAPEIAERAFSSLILLPGAQPAFPTPRVRQSTTA
ncbi:DUF6923 family protein [Nitratireductor kimnyeongensis]|uniref:DUF6923 family protein n=1 Tax=Nitratireductor kimnyeongensis TaxID=430679 RepID=A0ABW0T8W2_9HYPH|nr:hypothetical protein [Nitratireductor kimnyeongensis]